ncbi:aminotransferase class V-fold PLP-dependent enzyme [Thauera humireducens]|uniref:aminotransferase class V-fold PLP-dependent enzyme n=1 Tax=Thauera humireducens TaxID=1134435 RepID=UPI003C78221B
MVLVDGAQAVAHQAVDVQAIGCDFYAFSRPEAHGPTGIGTVLYGRGGILKAMPPWQGGGDMIRTVSFERTWADDTRSALRGRHPQHRRRHRPGGSHRLRARSRHRTDRGARARPARLRHGGGRRHPGVRLVRTARRKAGILSFLVDGIHPHDLGTILDAEGVAIRAGHHCAMPLMTRFGIPGGARLAGHVRTHPCRHRRAGRRHRQGAGPVRHAQVRMKAETNPMNDARTRSARAVPGGHLRPQPPAA